MKSWIADFRREWGWESKWLAVVIFLVVLLRIPSLFEPYWYGDEGIYQTIGLSLSRGWVLYRDIHDNKPPLIYHLAMVDSQPLMRGFLLVWTLAGVILFWKLAKGMFGARTAIILACLYGVGVSVPLLEGNVANSENFFITLTVAGMYCLWKIFSKSKVSRTKLSLVSGVAFSLGSLFKVPAVFDGLAGGLILVTLLLVKRDWKYFWLGLFLIGGFLVPWIGVGIFEWSQGAWGYFLNEAVFMNINYLSSWGTGSGRLMTRTIAAIVISVGLIILNKHLSLKIVFAGLWLNWAFFGAAVSGRPYAHYFLQIVPPFVLFVGGLLGKKKVLDTFVVGAGALLVLIVIFNTHLWYYRTIPYYVNFLSWASGRISKEDYYAYFDSSVPDLYKISKYLTLTTSPDERVFIWGDFPSIYALSGRLPVGRYTTAYHVSDFDQGQKETIKSLSVIKPRVVVWFGNEKRQFPALAWLVSNFYTHDKIVGKTYVYLRIPASYEDN